jgi:hypothetical protein
MSETTRSVGELVARVFNGISMQRVFEDMAAIGSQLGAFTLPWEGLGDEHN